MGDIIYNSIYQTNYEYLNDEIEKILYYTFHPSKGHLQANKFFMNGILYI